MKISNRPLQTESDKLYYYEFQAARNAFEYILRMPANKNKTVFLPAYIGQSSREGSGVFDPIRNTGANYVFYPMDNKLQINKSKLISQLKKSPPAILLLIHYWGFVDANTAMIKKTAKQLGHLVIEDYAHGLFTFFKNTDVTFDYAFFSLHKMFPYQAGGVLLSRTPIAGLRAYNNDFFHFHLSKISEKRVQNYLILTRLLKRHSFSFVKFLRPHLKNNIPQSLPLLIRNTALRDKLYFELNKQDFGVVSLYHELIGEIPQQFKNEKNISARILNLPVHQSVDPKQYIQLLSAMKKIAKG